MKTALSTDLQISRDRYSPCLHHTLQLPREHDPDFIRHTIEIWVNESRFSSECRCFICSCLQLLRSILHCIWAAILCFM